jgi:hypothetical protein
MTTGLISTLLKLLEVNFSLHQPKPVICQQQLKKSSIELNLISNCATPAHNHF